MMILRAGNRIAWARIARYYAGMPTARNLLVFHLGALGDFLLTWPLVMALGRLHPHSRIICITHPSKGALAERLLGVEWASIEAGWHQLHGDPQRLPEAAQRLLAGAHSIYSFIASADDPWAMNVRAEAPHAELCLLYPTPPAHYAGHATEYVLEQLAARPAVAAAMRQMLQSIVQRGIARRPGPGAGVIIHPGAGSRAKCWPPERFIELIGLLKERGRPVRVLLGEAERERWPADLIGQFQSMSEVRFPNTPLELCASLLEGRCYVGNDSGPSHLAGMLGLRCVCLFGPTAPQQWRPLGPDVQVLAAMPMELIRPPQVLELLEGGQ